MKRSTLALSLIILSGLLFPYSGVADKGISGFAKADNFQVRAETHLKCRTSRFDYSSGDLTACMNAGYDPDYKFDTSNQSIKLEGNSKGFIDIPRMATKFVAETHSTVAVFTFSAMHFAGTVDDEPLFVRALVDGEEAQPGPIVFTSGFSQTMFAASSFTFTKTVNAGMHIVQMQWSSESNNQSNYLRNASIFISVDSKDTSAHRVAAKSRKLGSPLNKADGAWTKIPHTELPFTMPKNGAAAITFSSVLKLKNGDYILIRPVIDNGAAAAVPVENTLAHRASHLSARDLTFTTGNLASGDHEVHFEWMSSTSGGITASASLHAWSLSAITAPRKTPQSTLAVVSQPGPATPMWPDFVPFPGFETEVDAGEISDVAVIFSAAFSGPGPVILTPMIDGTPLPIPETHVYQPTIKTDDKGQEIVLDAGGQSYTFAIKDLAARKTPYRIGIAYRGNTSAVVYNATMTVISKTRIGPDLAVGANMAGSSKERESIIEPVHGTRKVLAVIFDPDRPDAPDANAKFREDVDRVLFGAVPSAADYYKVVSGGRVTLEKAGVLGPYKGKKTNGEGTNENHYWDAAAHDPNGDEKCNDSTDAYCSPYDEQVAEALLRAGSDFDFEEYDLDRDGVITPNELCLVVITPQFSSTGSHAMPNFTPFVDSDQPLVVDNVILRHVFHWYTPAIGDGTDAELGLESAMVAAHELAHHFLFLDDAYDPYKFEFDGNGVQPCPKGGSAQCQKRYVNTAPQVISMMTYKTIDSSPHFDAFHKLQLGWVTPRIVKEASDNTLVDVKESKEVFVLPRYGTDAREYFLLETRYESDLVDDPLYDYSLLDSGLAVYHIIEPAPLCKILTGATAENCVPLLKPTCIASDLVWDTFSSNFLRPGLRLIQPDVTHLYEAGKTNFGETLFGNSGVKGVDLLDSAEGGMICPAQIGDPLPPGGRPLLLWSNGKASGYRLKAIKTNYATNAVTFSVEIDQ